MNRLTRADFERFPGVVSAEERAELYRMSDTIQSELRNERTAHAVLAATIETRRALPRIAQPKRDGHAVRPVPRWMQIVLGVLAQADDPARIAPAPTGSREIPAWLLAALLVIAIAVVTLFAPGANAAPINCQGDQEYYWQVAADVPNGAATWWTDCGYRYELPAVSIVPPVIDVPAAPVPEPATWALFAAGFAAACAIVSRRNRKERS